MTVTLRAAGESDAQILLEIQREASLAAFSRLFPPADYPFPSEHVLRRWREQLAATNVSVLIAEREGRAVGAAAYAPGRFDQLWVVPSEWGSGVAQVLYEEALRGLWQVGSTVCRLWVLAENHRAQRFYVRRGWRPDGRRTRTPYPPNPELVGYSLKLSRRTSADATDLATSVD